jgi:hypothetical protein
MRLFTRAPHVATQNGTLYVSAMRPQRLIGTSPRRIGPLWLMAVKSVPTTAAVYNDLRNKGRYVSMCLRQRSAGPDGVFTRKNVLPGYWQPRAWQAIVGA